MRNLIVSTAIFLVISTSTVRSEIAIIDTAQRVTSHLDQLRNDGVKVVGRYYSRCYQWAGKRLINMGRSNLLDDNKSERLEELNALLDGGFGILSIYQYRSNWVGKFFGRVRTRVRDNNGNHLFENGRYQYTYSNILDGNCSQKSTGHDAKTEALLDAAAAIAQAQYAGQPQGTAIYFGLDFNFGDRIDAEEESNILGDQVIERDIRSEIDARVLTYMRTVKAELAKHGYLLGVYGSGDAFNLLSNGLDEPIFDYSWIMASRSFSGTQEYHNSGNWNLFQNWTDLMRYNPDGLGLDTNIQNTNSVSDIGFWDRTGTVVVDGSLSMEIFMSHRFVCDGRAWIRNAPTLESSDIAQTEDGKNRRLYHANTVNLTGESVTIGGTILVEFDADDDGQADGWTNLGNLSANFAVKPKYYSVSEGLNIVCP